MTNTPPSSIVRQLLLDLELAFDTDVAWKVYTAHMPDALDQRIYIFDTAGRPDGSLMATGEQVEHEGFQIQVAGQNYLATWKKANEIALALDEQFEVEVTVLEDAAEVTYLIQNIGRTGAILPLGMEITKERRYFFSINAVMTIVTPEATEGFQVADGVGGYEPFLVAGGDEFFVQQ